MLYISMMPWLLFALSSAFGHSVFNALSKKALDHVPKVFIVVWASLVSSVLLGVWAVVRGVPELGSGFWLAAGTTAVLNIIAFPLLLKAYEFGELSTVFPMLLLTPLFMLGTSFVLLGEVVTGRGVAGMLITVFGLFVVGRSSIKHRNGMTTLEGNRNGMALGLLVAFLYSFSANFDKRTVLLSDAVFGPAVVLGLIAAGLLPVLLVLQYRQGIGATKHLFTPQCLVLPTVMGLVQVFDSAVFYTALSLGLASYTIVVKRMSILFGILWGRLFFQEKNLQPKLIGGAVAIIGLAVMLL